MQCSNTAHGNASLLISAAVVPASHPTHDYSSLLESLRLSGPQFDPLTPTNVTAQVGSHAFLHCTVHHLMDKSVSAECRVSHGTRGTSRECQSAAQSARRVIGVALDKSVSAECRASHGIPRAPRVSPECPARR